MLSLLGWVNLGRLDLTSATKQPELFMKTSPLQVGVDMQVDMQRQQVAIIASVSFLAMYSSSVTAFRVSVVKAIQGFGER